MECEAQRSVPCLTEQMGTTESNSLAELSDAKTKTLAYTYWLYDSANYFTLLCL